MNSVLFFAILSITFSFVSSSVQLFFYRTFICLVLSCSAIRLYEHKELIKPEEVQIRHVCACKCAQVIEMPLKAAIRGVQQQHSFRSSNNKWKSRWEVNLCFMNCAKGTLKTTLVWLSIYIVCPTAASP